jgi:hypothetical protein
MTHNEMTRIATIAKNSTLLESESGRVGGSAHREEYRTPDGKYLEITWDGSCGTSLPGWPAITQYWMSPRRSKTWRVSR